VAVGSTTSFLELPPAIPPQRCQTDCAPRPGVSAPSWDVLLRDPCPSPGTGPFHISSTQPFSSSFCPPPYFIPSAALDRSTSDPGLFTVHRHLEQGAGPSGLLFLHSGSSHVQGGGTSLDRQPLGCHSAPIFPRCSLREILHDGLIRTSTF